MNRDFDKTSTLQAKKVWGFFVMDETAKSYLFALQNVTDGLFFYPMQELKINEPFYFI